MVILDYYGHLDGPEPAKGLTLVAPDITFVIALPDRRIGGRGADDLAKYVGNRKAVDRRHEIVHTAIDGPVEFVYAVVTEAGVRTGAFLAAARVNDQGLIDRYHVHFDAGFSLVDWPVVT